MRGTYKLSKKWIWKLFLLTMPGVLFVALDTNFCLAAGNTYDTAVEAAYGDTFKSVYNEKLAGSPLEAECPDGVDTSNGHLILSRTDLYLEGTGGMDFELSRYYDSNEAIIGNPTVQAVDKLKIDTVKVHYTTQDGEKKTIVVNTAILNKHKKALKDLMVTYEVGDVHRENETVENTQRTKILSNEDFNVYGLASGWKFDLPWVETITIAEERKDSWGARPAYLHFGSKGTMGIETETDTKNKCYHITGLSDYSYADVKLEDWDKEVDGIRCRYLLRDKTGLRTYFNENGVVVLQKDNHNNVIRYTYTDKIYLKSITDSVGRVINFTYTDGDQMKMLTSITVEGTKVNGGVSKKIVRYTYDERNYTPHNSDTISGLVLKSATVDGSKETYDYRIVERLMSTSGYGIASQRVSTNESYLLNKVTADGNIQHYEYRASAIRGTKDKSAGQERDVVVQGYYVTREYSEDQKTGKKADGQKYDFFQKQNNKLLRFCDFEENKNEIWQYGREGLSTVAVVSSFNPNKYKSNGSMSDYIYEKSDIDVNTLRLKKDTKKSVSIYIYNSQKMLTEEVDYGKEKAETLYSYDDSGNGSLVVLETDKSYGTKGNDAITTKRGYSYDAYRNLLTRIKPAAYLSKNKGKEALFTKIYTYKGTDTGYPLEDIPFTLSMLLTNEEYMSANIKIKSSYIIADNGIDYAGVLGQKSVDGGEYINISKEEFVYDSAGNEIQNRVYPFYKDEGEKEVIQTNYIYNALGQQIKETVTLTSAKNPADNRTYTEEEIVYDSFGNEVMYTDENGLVTTTSYDEQTGEEKESIYAVGTEYETTDKSYVSSDGLKMMTLDTYNRVSIDIQDGLGNTIISKDEAQGTWTECTYDYGSDTGNSNELEEEETVRLSEEKTYTFTRGDNTFITNEDGETVANFYMTGKGGEVLSGRKYFYDNLGKEIGDAGFTNGEMDSAHCSSWDFYKDETEIKNGQIISTSYRKELDPSKYQSDVDSSNYYNQFDNAVLSETIVKSISDSEGNVVSKTETYKRQGNIMETAITYKCDEFGKVIQQNENVRKYQDGKWLPAYEKQFSYTYDENGNVTQTELKTKTEGESVWNSEVTKTEYDGQGNVTKEYSSKGVKENYAVKYSYDILGRVIKTELPQKNEKGKIIYQTIVTEYDTTGNITAQEEQIDGSRTQRTEYTYDERGNLTMVKNCLENSKAQYVQYVYDIEGNKVRQFTGMTSPLTFSVAEGASSGGADVFAYAGRNYLLNISGQKKSDVICETKYEYDERNRVLSYTDPEGRTERYTYDINGNLIKTVDKNGNIIENFYDYQNRLTKIIAKDMKNGKETEHTYSYDTEGKIASQDDIVYSYEDVSGQVTKETSKLTKDTGIEKLYRYDSADNRASFQVKIGGELTLALDYSYDGASKLQSVNDVNSNVADYKYDMDGNLSETTISEAGLYTTYAYDYGNHMIALKNTTGNRTISEYSASYFLNGQKSEEIADIRDESGKNIKRTAIYSYDLLGRITKETKTGSDDITYTYDGNNNRREMKVGKNTVSYQYNKNDELLRTDTLDADTGNNSVVKYKNDKNGNQLATVNRYELSDEHKEQVYIDIDVTLGDNQLNDNVVNHYNAFNQLTSAITKNYKADFTYDAEGLRTSKTVNGEKTVFVWDGDQLVMELSESGEVQKRYIRGNDLVYSDNGEGTEKQYYVVNLHGDVVQLTDKAGDITKVYQYDSFGNEEEPDKEDNNPFRYCGEYYDKEIDEIYLRARYYQPVLGRFLTRDTYTGEPGDALSLHLYTYCQNDGVNLVDPSGHRSYVFTIKEFKREAQGIRDVLADYYRTQSKLVITNSEKQFKKGWNNMKKGSSKKIECLVIDSHAGYDGFGKNVKEHYVEIINREIAKTLKKKDVKRLVLLGCNAGHYDHKYSNMAYYLRKKVNGPCIASDGTVESDASGCNLNSKFDSVADKYWRRERNETGRKRKKNKGWLMYKKPKKIIEFGKKEVTMEELLSFRGK